MYLRSLSTVLFPNDRWKLRDFLHKKKKNKKYRSDERDSMLAQYVVLSLQRECYVKAYALIRENFRYLWLGQQKPGLASMLLSHVSVVPVAFKKAAKKNVKRTEKNQGAAQNFNTENVIIKFSQKRRGMIRKKPDRVLRREEKHPRKIECTTLSRLRPERQHHGKIIRKHAYKSWENVQKKLIQLYTKIYIWPDLTKSTIGHLYHRSSSLDWNRDVITSLNAKGCFCESVQWWIFSDRVT